MSSNFGLPGGIPERRVRPIWDAIDSRQFKNALKHVASLLGKYPTSPYVLALKAHILERMGKPEEALSTCLKAKDLLYSDDSAVVDDLTLSTLQIAFERLNHLDLATNCYEHACGKFPNNLELMIGLFNCYVREYSFVRQQQTAIKMYKVAGEERFLLWAVCSIQLQVLCGNGGEKLLLLAEGLLKKHVAAHSLHEPEALIIYISILEQQEKYVDALEILSGNLGSLLMVEVDRLQIQGRLLARSADYAAATEVYKRILELCPDDWECFQHYLGCLLEDGVSLSNGPVEDKLLASHMEHQLSSLGDEEIDSRISRATSFVEKLLASTSDSLIRCPYLASLELERRKQLHGNENIFNLMEALVEYFSRFGHLACFVSDVEAFLLVLPFDKQKELIEKLKKTSVSIPQVPVKALGQSITIFKIEELTGSIYKLPVDEVESYVQLMVEMYCNSLTLSKDLDPQESMPGEELLSISSNVLVQLYWRTSNLDYILEAIMVLEFGLSIRRHVWQYKVLLVHLYSHLGTISLAYDWYKSLEVKNILLETFSHHIFPQMLGSPLWTELNKLLKDYLKFMDDHFRESADLTFVAYRDRNYSKVIEFVQFKERLQKSSQYMITRIETSILDLKQNAGNLVDEEAILDSLKCGAVLLDLSNKIGSKPLTFNEDFRSRPWWTPTIGKNYLLGPLEEISHFHRDNLMKEREAEAGTTIERRSLFARLIYLSLHNASAALKENSEANGCLPENKLSSEMESLLERYAKTLDYSLEDAVKLIGEVYQGLKGSEAFGSHVVDWVNLAVFCNAWKLTSTEYSLHNTEGCKSGGWLVDSLLEKCMLERIRNIDPWVDFLGREIPLLVQLVTEPLAWHGLIIQSLLRVSLPSGKKKKKGGTSDQSSSPLLAAARDSAQCLYSTVEEIIKQIKDRIKKLEDENLGTTFFPAIKGQDCGPGRALRVIENTVSSAKNAELGERITKVLNSWSSVVISRKIVSGQKRMLSELLTICESKHKMLNTPRKHNS
ncbi:hypothetical protein SAY86_008508 [Trapa natans]|uniref:Phagocyte signaling-impaired protein n=1 Tax=Trapa natans TaxID=22666 RepID=A0AAN7QEK3_TRANT|nr:hypothetical protein SAY86_008508 [Trapa natans]